MLQTNSRKPSFTRHTLGLAISTVLLATLQPALAVELAAVDGPMGTAIVDTQGLAPVIDIVAPNAQGLSHNQWQHYNVGTAGVVLNNSLTSGHAQIAGQTLAIGANAQFADTAASTILNEVVGTRGSTIDGEQVIFGQAADYVLSNPNGISLNGARLTLNEANNATYVVGAAVLEDGRIQRYDTRSADQHLVVDKGGVEVGAGAMRLIAPSVRIDGNLTAGGDLSVLLGRQQVDAQTLAISDIAQPPAAIDATLVGAMQARRIKIISTQDGAGVRMAVDRLHGKQGIEITSAGALGINSLLKKDEPYVQASVDAGTADLKLSSAGDMQLTSLALTGGLIDARSRGRLKFDAFSNSKTTRRDGTAEDTWYSLAPGESNAHVTENEVTHVGNSVVSTARVRLDGSKGIEIAATYIEGPESVDLYTGGGGAGLHAGAVVDQGSRTVWLDGSGAGEERASVYVERAQSTHIKGGSISLPNGTLNGAKIDATGSIDIGGKSFGATLIRGLDLKRTATQGNGARRVSLTGSRAHEAHRENAFQQQTEIKAQRDLSIGGNDILISGARLAGANVNVNSSGDLIIQGATETARLDGARPGADQALRSFDRTFQSNRSSVVTASKALSLKAKGERFRPGSIFVEGSHLSAKGAMSINARTNLRIHGIAQTQYFSLSGPAWGPVEGELQQGGWNSKGLRNSQARSTLAGGSMQLAAGNLLDMTGSALNSKGDIKLQANDIQLTGSSKSKDIRQEVWVHLDPMPPQVELPDDDSHTQITDRIHNGSSIKAGGNIDISAEKLATHATSVNAAGGFTVSDSLASFEDTPVTDADAIRRHYHGYVAPQQSSWQVLASLPLGVSEPAVPTNNGTTRDSLFVAGEVSAETAQRLKDLNVPLTLR